MEKQTRTFKVDVGNILPHPLFPNPRGPVRVSKEFKESIRQRGIKRPLMVMPSDEKGIYWLLGGARRLTAARSLGYEQVPVFVENPESDSEILALMGLDNSGEPIPTVVVKGGRIVGGAAYLAAQMKKAGTRLIDIAPQLDVTPDAAGALVRLCNDIPQVVQAVADGRMALTVYSIMKSKPADFKLHVVSARKAHVSAQFVRDVTRNWKSIKEKMSAEVAREGDETFVPESHEPGTQVQQSAPVSQRSNAENLQNAINFLRQVKTPVSGAELFLADQVGQLIEDIYDNLDEVRDDS